MKKLITALLGIFSVSSVFANPACAVCTVAIGATLSISRSLGVCDNAVAVWVGAFLVIMGYWMIKWFDKKKWYFWGRDILLILLSFSMIAGLYIRHLNYNPCFMFLDSFLICAILGGVVYAVSQKIYEYMKRHNNNHAHFPFEKVVMAIGMLLITSFLVAQFK